MNLSSLLIKVAHLAFCLVFFATNSLLAYAPETQAWTKQTLPIPHAWGDIRHITHPPTKESNRFVFLVQDVHLNSEVQRHTSQTLRELMSSGEVGLVGLEGVFGPVDLSRFHAVPDRDNMDAVADYLLKAHHISGAVHAGFVHRGAPPLFLGVDDKRHYEAHAEAYKKTRSQIKPLKSQWHQQWSDLQIKKKNRLNPELWLFDQKREAHLKRELPLHSYIRLCAATGAPVSPELNHFLQTLDIEDTLNFDKVRQDRSRLIEALLKKLSDKDLSLFLKMSRSYRLGHVRTGDFYRFLETVSLEKGLSWQGFPHLKPYKDYIDQAEKVDSSRILTALETLENQVYDTLITTKEEKDLILKTHALQLIRQLLSFSLMPHEWQRYRDVMRTVELDVKDKLTDFENFYRQAHIRDEKMARRLLAAMDRHHINKAVLVAGGYHSQGLEKRLSQAGLTVVTFTPRITKVESQGHADYLTQFEQEKTPLEKLFDGQELTLTPLLWLPRRIERLSALGYTALGSLNQADLRFRRLDPSVEKVHMTGLGPDKTVTAWWPGFQVSAAVQAGSGQVQEVAYSLKRWKGAAGWGLFDEQVRPFSWALLLALLTQGVSFSAGVSLGTSLLVGLAVGVVFGLPPFVRFFVYRVHQHHRHNPARIRVQFVRYVLFGLATLVAQTITVGVLQSLGVSPYARVLIPLLGFFYWIFQSLGLSFVFFLLLSFLIGHLGGGLTHEAVNQAHTHFPSWMAHPSSGEPEPLDDQKVLTILGHIQLSHSSFRAWLQGQPNIQIPTGPDGRRFVAQMFVKEILALLGQPEAQTPWGTPVNVMNEKTALNLIGLIPDEDVFAEPLSDSSAVPSMPVEGAGANVSLSSNEGPESKEDAEPKQEPPKAGGKIEFKRKTGPSAPPRAPVMRVGVVQVVRVPSAPPPTAPPPLGPSEVVDTGRLEDLIIQIFRERKRPNIGVLANVDVSDISPFFRAHRIIAIPGRNSVVEISRGGETVSIELEGRTLLFNHYGGGPQAFLPPDLQPQFPALQKIYESMGGKPISQPRAQAQSRPKPQPKPVREVEPKELTELILAIFLNRTTYSLDSLDNVDVTSIDSFIESTVHGFLGEGEGKRPAIVIGEEEKAVYIWLDETGELVLENSQGYGVSRPPERMDLSPALRRIQEHLKTREPHNFEAWSGLWVGVVSLLGALGLAVLSQSVREAGAAGWTLLLALVLGLWVGGAFLYYGIGTFVAQWQAAAGQPFRQRVVLALLEPIANSSGYRSPAFVNLKDGFLKRMIDLHESTPNHWVGLVLMVPGVYPLLSLIHTVRRWGREEIIKAQLETRPSNAVGAGHWLGRPASSSVPSLLIQPRVPVLLDLKGRLPILSNQSA